MLGKALIAFGLVAAGALGTGAWLSSAGSPHAAGFGWGAALGLVCASTALGGAALAEVRNLPGTQALAVVVLGMLLRLGLVGIGAALALGIGALAPLPFLVGLAGTYLPGQGIEVFLLVDLSRRRAGGG